MTRQKYGMLKQRAADIILPDSLAFMWEDETLKAGPADGGECSVLSGQAAGAKVTHPCYGNLMQGTAQPRAAAREHASRLAVVVVPALSVFVALRGLACVLSLSGKLNPGHAFVCGYLFDWGG